MLISLDSVRADALDFQSETTPTLTKLAGRGTSFTSAFSGTSWTLPAHVELFTGSPPVFHGVQSDEVAIDAHMPVLAELLRERGYYNAGVYTSTYLWDRYGFGRGFDVYRNALAAGDEDASRALSSVADVTTGRVVEEVERIVREAPADRPLFLFLHLFDPHYDYVPPAPYDRMLDPDYAGEIDGRGYFENPRVWDETKDPPRQLGERDLAHIQALYMGEIAYVDSELGRVFELLERHRAFEDSLVIVTADHGEEFFEHGRRGHQQSLFDEVLRVPLLVVPPRAQASQIRRRVPAQVRLADIAPTVLESAGLEAPSSSLGRSLWLLMKGEEEPVRPVMASLYAPNSDESGGLRHQLLLSLRTPRKKLHRYVRVRDGRPEERRVAFYDLERDPHERRPIRDPNDPRVRAATLEFERELARMRERWEVLPHEPDAERFVELSGDAEAGLMALGYLEEPGAARERSIALPWGLAPPPAVVPASARKAHRAGRSGEVGKAKDKQRVGSSAAASEAASP